MIDNPMSAPLTYLFCRQIGPCTFRAYFFTAHVNLRSKMSCCERPSSVISHVLFLFLIPSIQIDTQLILLPQMLMGLISMYFLPKTLNSSDTMFCTVDIYKKCKDLAPGWISLSVNDILENWHCKVHVYKYIMLSRRLKLPLSL